MSGSLQTFLADATTKAADELIAALELLPEDKQQWSPGGNARTALNMVAEVAMNNGSTAEMLKTHTWPEDFTMEAYLQMLNDLSQDREKALALLRETTPQAVSTILTVSDEDLGAQIPMPWGPSTVAEVMAYPYWNAKYHAGQITYLASLLEPAD